MPATVSIGLQDFEKIRARNVFYIDKTKFIREWWENGDEVTLITRPRRFGKTLLLNTVDRFFSNQYRDQARWFEGLSIWEDETFRALQGTRPVIFLSFAAIKSTTYEGVVRDLKRLLFRLYNRFDYLMDSAEITEQERIDFRSMSPEMDTTEIADALNTLSEYLYRVHREKVIILLDEYDTPMQEAYVNGFWDEIAALFRALFNATFKTNPYLDRALMTGITRVSRESMFSDLNNLVVVSMNSNRYTDAFGFTEDEVYQALDTYGYDDREGVKHWYDGFTFGDTQHIYNPWSIINFLREGKLQPYWANTSGNALASSLIRRGDIEIKEMCEDLISGKSIVSRINDQIVYGEIQDNEGSVWSLLLASGYLKVLEIHGADYTLALTNYEVQQSFRSMIRGWFGNVQSDYNSFTRSLLSGDLQAMNAYMNRIALATFSSFDTGLQPSGSEPERFYHGFVLGLIVDLKDRYVIRSNRESGFGRYDVMLEPNKPEADDAFILEFKVHDGMREADLEATVASAHAQITEKQYAAELTARGIPEERIHSYGFAFRGKEVLIG